MNWRLPVAVLGLLLSLSWAAPDAEAGMDPVTAYGLFGGNRTVNHHANSLLDDIVAVPEALLPVLRLPLGIVKTVSGVLLPGVPAAIGYADISAGLAAPFNTVMAVLNIPLNTLRRL